MASNNSKSEIRLANAFTNNTFSLEQTHISLRNAVESSYKYLNRLQKSYMDIYRGHFTQEDLFITFHKKVCLTIDKDFIDVDKRLMYRKSEFYGKTFTLEDISTNSNIFAYTPIICIDDQYVSGFELKCTLDGKTEVLFNHIPQDKKKEYCQSEHIIEVTFLKEVTTCCVSNINNQKIISDNYSMDISELNISNYNNQPIFFYMKNHDEYIGTNLFIANIIENKIQFRDRPSFIDFINNNSNIDFVFIIPNFLYEISGFKTIQERIDSTNHSALCIIQPEEFETYRMPVPSNNLLIFRIDRFTGETKFENNIEVVHHYPNIYEIISNEIDQTRYYFKIFFMYKKAQEQFQYNHNFKYIYKYLTRKVKGILQKDSLTFEEAINELLYVKNTEYDQLQKYFFSIFDYEDAEYIYSMGDFMTTNHPYDFDYKIDKMHEFISYNPFVLSDYAEKVAVPYHQYFLYVENIDLSLRIRNNSSQECKDNIEFDKPHYVFSFRNETGSLLDLRFFIDGLFCGEAIQILEGLESYIYIPCDRITSTSYIEIERFYTYDWKKTISFESVGEQIELEFKSNENIKPTLYDLFITDESFKVIDRNKFKLFALINSSEYDISDIIGTEDEEIQLLINNISIDDSGLYWIEIPLENSEILWKEDNSIELSIDNDSSQYGDNIRLPLKYLLLNKIKIQCNDQSLVNKKMIITITKNPSIKTVPIETFTSPKIQLNKDEKNIINRTTFARTFVNDRFIHTELTLFEDGDEVFVVPRVFVDPRDVVYIDITPYSYELKFKLDEIPLDYVIDFGSLISKPFNLSYYDIYLNGRKLSDMNIQLLSPNKIKLINVDSRYNLYVYEKDRDIEYYGIKGFINTSVDDFLESPFISDDDKMELIDDIISDFHDKEYYTTNNEDDYYKQFTIMDDIYAFYFDIIMKEKIVQPNSFTVDKSLMQEKYPDTLERFGYGNHLVMQPNKGFNADHVLKIGDCMYAPISHEKE